MVLTRNPNIFANNPLDRMGHKRGDAAWLEGKRCEPETLVVPLWHLMPLVLPEHTPGAGRDTGWLPFTLLESMFLPESLFVFLGINRRGKALFALDISHARDPENEGPVSGMGRFEDLRELAMAGDMPSGELAIMAQARGMLEWHRRHGFCAVCGGATIVVEGGYKRHCEACGAEHFPRTDPVVIMAALHQGRCFLGRQSGWPPGMFSALAGFMEPGETIEEAVARELHEEAGLEISSVRYHSTQPWPWPSSLMIGCFADAVSEEIYIDGVELEEGRWFEQAELREMINRRADPEANEGGLMAPPPMAIAHQIIKALVDE